MKGEKSDSFLDVARAYWASPPPGGVFGVAAIGGGGLAEIYYREHEELVRLRRLVRFDATQRVLEVGCGEGRWIEGLAPHVARYVAVDMSAAMLDAARARILRAGLRNVDLVEASAQDFTPRESETFDVVYFSGLTQYLPPRELSALLARATQWLTPGGVLIDRSTVHRRETTTVEADGYASIYRTGDDIVARYAHEGLRLRARETSYESLRMPNLLLRVMRSRTVARLVKASAPRSFDALRLSARVGRTVLGDTGELTDFSHEFFVFERAPEAKP